MSKLESMIEKATENGRYLLPSRISYHLSVRRYSISLATVYSVAKSAEKWNKLFRLRAVTLISSPSCRLSDGKGDRGRRLEDLSECEQID